MKPTLPKLSTPLAATQLRRRVIAQLAILAVNNGKFFFSSRRRQTSCSGVSWARRCVYATGACTRLRALLRRGDDGRQSRRLSRNCLLYTSDAAAERSSVDLGGRRIIKK